VLRAPPGHFPTTSLPQIVPKQGIMAAPKQAVEWPVLVSSCQDETGERWLALISSYKAIISRGPILEARKTGSASHLAFLQSVLPIDEVWNCSREKIPEQLQLHLPDKPFGRTQDEREPTFRACKADEVEQLFNYTYLYCDERTSASPPTSLT